MKHDVYIFIYYIINMFVQVWNIIQCFDFVLATLDYNSSSNLQRYMDQNVLFFSPPKNKTCLILVNMKAQKGLKANPERLCVDESVFRLWENKSNDRDELKHQQKSLHGKKKSTEQCLKYVEVFSETEEKNN